MRTSCTYQQHVLAQALSTVSTLEEPDVRWEAEIHFKTSVALELADRGLEAQEHVKSAITLISRLIKEVRTFRADAAVDCGLAESAYRVAARIVCIRMC